MTIRRLVLSEVIRKKLNNNFLILSAIFLLALLLRTVSLSTVPFAFHTDELINGYVGRFLLLNGKDLYGNTLPLFYFDKFGDYRVVLPMYIFGASTFLFGVNEFGVRFASSFFGALMVMPVYGLADIIFKNKKIAFMSAFFLAVLPWHIILSRATSEGIIGLTIFSFAIYFVVKGILEEKLNYIAGAWVPFVITYFMYPSFRVLSPLALLPLPFLFPGKKNRILLVIGIIIFFLFSYFVSTTDWGKGRFQQTSIFYNKDLSRNVNSTNTAYSNDEGSNSITTARIFHNKPIGYIRLFLEQYFNYFSPSFLLLDGGLPYRYALPGTGLIYIVFTILLLASLLPVFVKISNRLFIYVLYLFAIAPLPGALTMDDVPNTHRVLLMIFPLVILASYGMLKIITLLNKKRKIYITGFSLFFSLLLLLESVYFFHQYFNHTASLKSILRNDGNREIVQFVKENRNKYAKVYMPMLETLPVYYLFYSGDFKGSYAGKFYKTDTILIDSIDNITFVRDWCPTKVLKKEEIIQKSIIIEDGDCENRHGYALINMFYRKDMTRAFKVLSPQF